MEYDRGRRVEWGMTEVRVEWGMTGVGDLSGV